MAERRMFSKSIIDSDMFLDMPSSTQNLYFHLAMRADDDGFVNSPQRIMRTVSCSKNDMDMLIFKNFVIPFESGVCVIKHWRIHNYLRSDRYTPTIYTEEKNRLSIDDSKAYVVGFPVGIPDGIPDDVPAGDVGKYRLGKDSVVEDSIGKSDYPPPKGDSTPKFIKPSLDEVISYCKERNNGVDAQRWYDFYESKGWMVGKNKMKDWRAAIRTWERNDNQSKPSQRTGNYRGSAKPEMPVVNDTGPKREITPEERERMLARAKKLKEESGGDNGQGRIA